MAALLTILGYSLYDVVIVFDRIRENVPIMRKSTYREIVNTSVHETLTRSIITSLTTLIPLTVLYFFGGDTLKDFAFALIVGILSGGLSSIAIAAPIAALWKEREPENKRRAAKAERRASAVGSATPTSSTSTRSRAPRRPSTPSCAWRTTAHPPTRTSRTTRGGAASGSWSPARRRSRAETEAELEPRSSPRPRLEPEPEPELEPELEPEPRRPSRREPDGRRRARLDGEPEADGTTTGAEPENGAPRQRPDPGRQRRHRQVQRKRRR